MVVLLPSLDDVAELHTTKRIRELADLLREQAGKRGAGLRPGDYVERMIADKATTTARLMGITPRTVLANYVLEDRCASGGPNWPERQGFP